MKMHSRFIKLYDDSGYEYVVNIDKITCVSVKEKRSGPREIPRSIYAARAWTTFAGCW